MKKKFSTKWKGSKNPGKKRKYAAEAPLHIKRKFLSANLSKELRKKHGKRSLVLRKGDTVKITRGKFKGKKGQVVLINIKRQRVEIDGIQVKKQDGSKINVPVNPSNVQITELHLEDKKRMGLKIKTKKAQKVKSEDKNKTKSKKDIKQKKTKKSKKKKKSKKNKTKTEKKK